MASPLPRGYPRISSSLAYDNSAAAIDWLCKAFGFEVSLRVDGEAGAVVHSELVIGSGSEGMIMLGDKPRDWNASPKHTGGKCTQAIMVFVDNCDEHCARARAAGGTITMEPTTTDYGDDYWSDRTYECVDPEGHHWWFVIRHHDR
jgi:uncharacterized glyoxalase superfamily protein PhnB